ncbi:MAG: Gmad2 immunoglobulin-like domain-containing protein [Dermatophilaceae bacterium]
MTDDITPGQFSDIEEGLRRAFAEEADSITPGERLAEIRSDVAEVPVRAASRWLAPVAAAVAVLIVAGLAWLLVLRPDQRSPVTMATGTTTAPATPSPTEATPNESAQTQPAPTRPETATSAAVGTQSLPVYYVGPGSTANPWLLYRTFLPEQRVANEPTALASKAVGIALAGQDDSGHSLTAYEGYLQPWQPGTTATTTVGPAEIRVILSGPGRAGLAADQRRIAVQQLVWTATAAAGANLPVRVTTASEGPIFEGVPGGVFKRPSATYEDLAPLWITEPSRYLPVPASHTVVVSGQACVFEAQFSWELSRGGAVIRSGSAMASSGCPERGTYTIDLGVLPPGDYAIRVFERSAADGSVFAETQTPFTVAGG